jgi:nucleotide-binding universal stress UspA family protein
MVELRREHAVTTDERVVRIVVGVSGSPSSTAALCWAASEARLYTAEIWAVHAWSAPMEMLAPYAPRRGVPAREQQREASGALLTAAIRYAFGPDGCGVVVRPTLVEGLPIPVLLRYAANAHLLVLGRRLRPNQVDGIALGAVARVCMSSTRCPTVLIPGADVVADAETSPSPGWCLCVGQ